MKKLFKKSVALVLSATLCLTALIGCLTVSADETETTYEVTYSVGTASGKAGETVKLNGSLEILSGISAHDVTFTFPKGFTVDGITGKVSTNETDGTDETTTSDNSYYDKIEGTGDGDYTQTETDGVTVIRFLNVQNNEKDTTETMNLVFNVTIDEGLDAGEYPVKVAAVAAKSTGDNTEAFINKEKIELKDGTITVEADTPTHEHEWEFVSATPAVENGANGTINFKCTSCKETKTVSNVTYLKMSGLASPDVVCTATTQLVLKTSVKNYGSATAGYLTVTHHYGNGAADSVEVLDINDAEKVGKYYQWIIGVKSIHFSDTFTTVFYTERDGAWVSGLVKDVSIKSAAMNAIESSSTTEAIKKVAANLLKMGAEAQKAFSYDADNLADSELTGDYAQYVTTTTPSVVKDTSANFITVDSDPVKSGEKLGFAAPSISLSDSISINLKVVTKFYNLESLSNLKMVLTYTSFNGAEISEAITEYTTNTSGQFEFKINVIAPNMRVPVQIQLFDGDTAVSDIATFSVEAVMAHALNSDTSYSNLVYSIINYSDAAKAAF